MSQISISCSTLYFWNDRKIGEKLWWKKNDKRKIKKEEEMVVNLVFYWSVVAKERQEKTFITFLKNPMPLHFFCIES